MEKVKEPIGKMESRLYRANLFGAFKIKGMIMANWKVIVKEGDVVRVNKRFVAGESQEAINKVSNFIHHSMGPQYVDFRKRSNRIEIEIYNCVEALIAEGTIRLTK